MLKKVLVANRGEIALRIIRECKDNNIETVSVYSTEDKESLHVLMANKSVCIGPPSPNESYLNKEALIQVALATGCDSIHPGFGFLSESADFSQMCEDNNIIFIGPKADVIDKMGNKSEARRTMIEAGVPVVKGSEGTVNCVLDAKNIAKDIGLPILIKASAGGGGRGMRIVREEEDIEKLFFEAKSEAEAAFGDGSLYIEKLIENPKHIEVQVLADNHGNIIHLGERNCSIQRKNQKLLEEAPAFCLSNPTKDNLYEAAVMAARSANYRGAGTIEFVVDEKENFYFIEMNTRIQVEHPVTEMITGVNIVKEQLRIASNLPISVKQEEVKMEGYAIECRICAENPSENFRPSPGTIEFLHLPCGNDVRVETGVYNGCNISPYYDSMIAKIIVHDSTRIKAVRKMRRALEEMVVRGIDTNIALQHVILYNKEFLRGHYNTSFMDSQLEDMLKLLNTAKDIRELEM